MAEPGRIGVIGEETQEELSLCPTFNSYSSDGLAEIAARVTDEVNRDSEFAEQNLAVLREDDDDFEFSLVVDDSEVSLDGQIRPVFPIFNRDLLVNDSKESTSEVVESEIGIPLKKLFIQDGEEEGQPPSSSSSSEADELESIPPGTYCVWRPKKVESPANRCKKSNSTGSASKRWKFLDLLRRSNSDGKDSYVFLTPKHVEPNKSEKHESSKAKQPSGGVVKAVSKLKEAKGVPPLPSSAHEAFYVRNRAMKQGDKKKSYLPYRQDVVGFSRMSTVLAGLVHRSGIRN
ncbi:hypothetical protein ACH5RR_011073 [Cinchona calisaya]|uniref:Uncharacterized protein n=1 Tax=Cinchona calisaya TaxID=153742 RepID=A0ABD3A6G2_9GENT